ncbi:MAG: GGDEF domain-containing protein [Synechococcales cyanobacterium T60_A2020_003]|nr:GGDEF domain-containing protein [Synechococcales cyanobacterium T60_A2020_003]
MGAHAEILSPIASHLETCVQLAAHLCHAPIAWLSVGNLLDTPMVLGVGCSSEKLEYFEQEMARDRPLQSDALLWRNDGTNGLTLLPFGGGQWFKAAWPLISSRKFVVGHLCVVDYIARQLDEGTLTLVEQLARQMAWMIERQILDGETHPDTSDALEIVWQTNQKLQLRVESLQEEHFYLNQLNYFMDTLQDYGTFSEAIAQLPALLKAMFPDQWGRLYLSVQAMNAVAWQTKPSNCVETLIWGREGGTQQQKLPVNCPVIQSLYPYYSIADSEESRDMCSLCKFSDGVRSQDNFCVPLVGYDSHIPPLVNGVLSVSVDSDSGWSHLQRQMVIQVARHLGKVLTRLKQYDLIHEQSIRDALTGLFNRRYLAEVLPQILHRAHHGHYPVGVIVFDIDHFKQFNDRYGHLAGDKVLQDFGVFLKGFVRGTDLACRYGGEEFALILPEANLERVMQRAERLRQGMHYMKMEYQGQALGTVTISAGVASFPRNGETLEDLIAAADSALYEAKAQGRDRVCVAQE